jgi:hypothetical protein
MQRDQNTALQTKLLSLQAFGRLAFDAGIGYHLFSLN